MLVSYRPAATGACRHVGQRTVLPLEGRPSEHRVPVACCWAVRSTRYQKVPLVRITPDLRKLENGEEPGAWYKFSRILFFA